jgi:hypothetical protein
MEKSDANLDRTALAELVHATVETEADEALGAERAMLIDGEIEAGWLIVTLKPANILSGGLEISIDSPFQVTCVPGSNGMSFEIFSKASLDIQKRVRSLVRALVAGEYQERVNDEGSRLQVVAEWDEDGYRIRSRHNVIRIPQKDAAGWRAVTYDPY